MPRKLFTSLLCPSMKVTEDQLETDYNLLTMERNILATNRRNFLGALAAAGATAATLGVAGFATPAEAQSTAPSITDVLNFALNLEYLEANLYIAVSGQTALSSTDTGSGAGTIMNAPGQLQLDAQTQATAAGLAMDELHHIELLRSAITAAGGIPISQPAIDYSMGGKLSITTQAQFLMAARQFTAVGGSAYAGSAQYLVSNTTVLTAASQILGAEGQHGGCLNYQCNLQGVYSPAVDAEDVPPSSTTYFTVNSQNALAPARTTSMVLGIVYGVATPAAFAPAGISSGGFFPNGLNGNIKST